jgi:hypothetical protein
LQKRGKKNVKKKKIPEWSWRDTRTTNQRLLRRGGGVVLLPCCGMPELFLLEVEVEQEWYQVDREVGVRFLARRGGLPGRCSSSTPSFGSSSPQSALRHRPFIVFRSGARVVYADLRLISWKFRFFFAKRPMVARSWPFASSIRRTGAAGDMATLLFLDIIQVS